METADACDRSKRDGGSGSLLSAGTGTEEQNFMKRRNKHIMNTANAIEDVIMLDSDPTPEDLAKVTTTFSGRTTNRNRIPER